MKTTLITVFFGLFSINASAVQVNIEKLPSWGWGNGGGGNGGSGDGNCNPNCNTYP